MVFLRLLSELALLLALRGLSVCFEDLGRSRVCASWMSKVRPGDSSLREMWLLTKLLTLAHVKQDLCGDIMDSRYSGTSSLDVFSSRCLRNEEYKSWVRSRSYSKK